MTQSPEALIAAFTDDVTDLLERKYGTLPPNDLLNAFYGALNTFYTRPPSARATPPEPEPEPAPPKNPLECTEERGRRVFSGHQDGGFILAIEVFSPQAFAELTSQMRSRTLIAKTSADLKRNDEFDFCVMLPVIDSEIWMPGTVISNSNSGLVFKVFLSSKEVEVWQEAAAAFKAGRNAPRRALKGPQTSPFED